MSTATLALGFRLTDPAGPARLRPPVDPVDAVPTLDLVVKARTGDQDAVDELFARYEIRLRRWAHGRLPAAARSFRSTKWVLIRRSAKKRNAFRVSALFFMPNICTSIMQRSLTGPRGAPPASGPAACFA